MLNLHFKVLLIKLFLVLNVIFIPLYPVALTMLVLIGLNFITGIYKAYQQKKAITSHSMTNTIRKSILYLVAIISGFIVETFIIPYIPLTKIISGFIALTELKSISENVGAVTGINYWSKIQEYLKRPNVDSPLSPDENEKDPE